MLRKQDGGYLGIGWNPVESGAGEEKRIVLSLAADAGAYSLLTETVDEETCNPLKVWHDLGEPADLTDGQKKLLQQAAQPFVQTCRLEARADMWRSHSRCGEMRLSVLRYKKVRYSPTAAMITGVRFPQSDGDAQTGAASFRNRLSKSVR